MYIRYLFFFPGSPSYCFKTVVIARGHLDDAELKERLKTMCPSRWRAWSGRWSPWSDVPVKPSLVETVPYAHVYNGVDKGKREHMYLWFHKANLRKQHDINAYMQKHVLLYVIVQSKTSAKVLCDIAARFVSIFYVQCVTIENIYSFKKNCFYCDFEQKSHEVRDLRLCEIYRSFSWAE